jgi:hypothetical protein
MLRVMYQDRFAKLPFVPAGWFDEINKIHGTNISSPNYLDVLLPVPAFDGFGNPSPAMPEWLDNDAKRKAWDEARTALKDGYTKFIQNEIDNGRELLNQLYANADFWNRLYNAAVYIAELPGVIAKNAFQLFWPYILVGGVIFAGYWYITHHRPNKKETA